MADAIRRVSFIKGCAAELNDENTGDSLLQG
jgi:hypothetical protein